MTKKQFQWWDKVTTLFRILLVASHSSTKVCTYSVHAHSGMCIMQRMSISSVYSNLVRLILFWKANCLQPQNIHIQKCAVQLLLSPRFSRGM